MGNFKITSSSLNNGYAYDNTNVTVQGNYNMDAQTNTVQNISGTVYKATTDGKQGEYMGNFNGYLRDGEIKYTISEMTRKDANKTWDAIDEIEENIFATDTDAAE